MSAMDGWMAARVVRKHTLPYHRPEVLAEHTWGVIHILFYVWPSISGRTVMGAMYHDIGEHRSGDIPGDFKADYPEVREFCDDYENKAARDVLPERLHCAIELSRFEREIIKYCDKIEFAFSCYHEWMLGNRYSLAPMERTLEMARNSISSDIWTELPEEVQLNISAVTAEAQRLLEQMRATMTTHKEIRFAS